jgi:hypothetical protein
MLVNYQFNPIEKYLEMVERNRELYERLLQAEREKIGLLEKMINKKSSQGGWFFFAYFSKKKKKRNKGK